MTDFAPLYPRIFVSHSHKDNDFGFKLVQDLRRLIGNDTSVWYDAQGGLHGGDTWWDKIKEELKARPVFIVILSPDALASSWVKDEIRIAWKLKNSPSGKFIIPILYRQCEVPDDLDTLQVIPFLSSDDYKASFRLLLSTLGLPSDTDYISYTDNPVSQHSAFEQQLVPQIEIAFANKDWTDYNGPRKLDR